MLGGVVTGPVGGDSGRLALVSGKRHLRLEAAAQFTDAPAASSHERLSFDRPREARASLNGDGYLHLCGYGSDGTCHELG